MQLSTVFTPVFVEVDTIVPLRSKPAIVFGDDKITLPDVINWKILEYLHWSDIIALHGSSYFLSRSIYYNERLMFDLTMQRIDEIINYLNKKSISNEHCFVLKNRVKYMDEDGYPNCSGYIVHTSKKSVWIVGCDDLFDEGSVVRQLRNSKVSHVRPFVGEVLITVINYHMA
jgi:hypothetical protein